MRKILIILSIVSLVTCSKPDTSASNKVPEHFGNYYEPKWEPEPFDTTLKGVASYYGHGDGFHGKTMANGKVMDKYKFTAASPLIKGTKRPKYKLGTKLLLINPENGKSIEVVITDTGGFRKYGRELDLSYGAFKALGDPDKGIIMIEIEILENKL